MDLKNLMAQVAQVVRPVNPTTTGELPAPELAQLSEMSEEDLLQIIGGFLPTDFTVINIENGGNQGYEGGIINIGEIEIEI